MNSLSVLWFLGGLHIGTVSLLISYLWFQTMFKMLLMIESLAESLYHANSYHKTAYKKMILKVQFVN